MQRDRKPLAARLDDKALDDGERDRDGSDELRTLAEGAVHLDPPAHQSEVGPDHIQPHAPARYLSHLLRRRHSLPEDQVRHFCVGHRGCVQAGSRAGGPHTFEVDPPAVVAD